MPDSKLLRGPRAHSVAWMLDNDWLAGTVTCHATEGADCRLTCPEDCEVWNFTNHEHKLVDGGKCIIVEWLGNQGNLADSHAGSHAPVDGFIELEWDGDHPIWRYADA